jgi:hypothetical protein
MNVLQHSNSLGWIIGERERTRLAGGDLVMAVFANSLATGAVPVGSTHGADCAQDFRRSARSREFLDSLGNRSSIKNKERPLRPILTAENAREDPVISR